MTDHGSLQKGSLERKNNCMLPDIINRYFDGETNKTLRALTRFTMGFSQTKEYGSEGYSTRSLTRTQCRNKLDNTHHTIQCTHSALVASAP